MFIICTQAAIVYLFHIYHVKESCCNDILKKENHSTQAADYSGGCTTESKNVCFNFGVEVQAVQV